MCICLQAQSRAAAVLSAMGHHQEAANTLRSLKQLQEQQGTDSRHTMVRIVEAESKLAAQPMNVYLVLGLQPNCSPADVSVVSCFDIWCRSNTALADILVAASGCVVVCKTLEKLQCAVN